MDSAIQSNSSKGKNRFLEITLGLALVFIIWLWFHHYMSSKYPGPGQKDKNNKFIMLPATGSKSGLIVNDIELPAENNKLRLSGPRSINVGFHQRFKHSIPNEIGWRSFYIRNFSGLSGVSSLQQSNPGSIASNYLSCLGNTDNVYKYVNY
jgi:hypothetical protein